MCELTMDDHKKVSYTDKNTWRKKEKSSEPIIGRSECEPDLFVPNTVSAILNTFSVALAVLTTAGYPAMNCKPHWTGKPHMNDLHHQTQPMCDEKDKRFSSLNKTCIWGVHSCAAHIPSVIATIRWQTWLNTLASNTLVYRNHYHQRKWRTTEML